jgi:rhamnogalacturonyl hydrolase YesR
MHPYPNPSILVKRTYPVSLSIAKYWVDQLKPDSQQLADITGGAAADAASLGVAFFLAEQHSKGSESQTYAKYLKREKHYLLNVVPRDNATGAISHRPVEEPFQAWDDFVYMVPPFLAEYAVKHHDLSVAREAYKQIQAYRTLLIDPETNLWHHVRGGYWGDEKLWGTGMAWAVAGIARVYTTLQHSVFQGPLQSELKDLATWANDIIAATMARPHVNTFLSTCCLAFG